MVIKEHPVVIFPREPSLQGHILQNSEKLPKVFCAITGIPSLLDGEKTIVSQDLTYLKNGLNLLSGGEK